MRAPVRVAATAGKAKGIAEAGAPTQAASPGLAQPTLSAAPMQRKSKLPGALISRYKAHSGVDLSHVNVTYNSDKPEGYGAAAYTQGSEIHLAAGQEHNLAHEAWHAVQQAQGRVTANGSVAGAPLNDDAKLEAEADRMAKMPAGLASPAAGPEPAGSGDAPPVAAPAAAAPVQRVITIGKSGGKVKTYGAGQVAPKALRSSLASFKEMAESTHTHHFDDEAAYHRAATAANKRRQWWNKRGGGAAETRDLDPHDPMYAEIHSEIMANHRDKPYATDALHEGGPLMGAYMDAAPSKWAKAKNMFSALFSQKTLWGEPEGAQPNLNVTRIQMIKNQALKDDYARAKGSIAATNHGDANEQALYSGHGPVTQIIADHGMNPTLGPYDPKGKVMSGKGHGALGRGSYFSDQVDKALTYSSIGQGPGEERSFFRHDVLLGNVHENGVRGAYRHRHHNEMVKTARSARNTTRAEGESAADDGGADLTAFDSVKGTKAAKYKPGGNIARTAWHKSQFDSNEYMVRNADQILPKYRIYYTQ